VSGYSDWLQSPYSARVWLQTSMTAKAQFAFVNPLHRLKHWIASKGKRVDCWKQRDKECFYCNKGIDQQHEYAYGVYIGKGDAEIKYLHTNLTTHTHIQNIFSQFFDESQNPCDLVFAVERTEITNLSGVRVLGYDIKQIDDEEMFVPEVLRPSPLSPFQNLVRDFKWIVPEEIVVKLLDYDSKPFNLIDLFLLIKQKAPKLPDKTAKSYAVRLLENGVLDVKKAKEYRH
jgi:hypothetical protein